MKTITCKSKEGVDRGEFEDHEVSKLVFYAQSTGRVISGQFEDHEVSCAWCERM